MAQMRSSSDCEDVTDNDVTQPINNGQSLNNCFGLSDTEEHFTFTPTIDDLSEKDLCNAYTSDGYHLSSNNTTNGNSRQTFQQRNTWLRSSLRRSGAYSNSNNNNNNNNNKRISSSAHHANQLYRSSPTNCDSPNSRSSLSCESDDMTNDPISLEEDVLNLTQKIQLLQDQVNTLTEGQLSNDDRYTKVKQENANLLTKIHSLEEQLREIEIQSEERRQEERRRYKDAMARHEREKSQESEQYINRIYNLQQELLEAKDESRKYQNIIERLKNVKIDLEEQIKEKSVEIDALSVEVNKLREVIRRYHNEEHANSRLIEALNQELTDIRQPQQYEPKLRALSSSDDIEMLVNSEMEKDLKQLKDENRTLREANEELQALLLNNSLEEGRTLLKEGEAASLAIEMGNLTIDQLRVALKEQQDVNVKLRSYIDGILLNIVENYPQLLEVKSK